MDNNTFTITKKSKLHFIGIGGVGMSGLAQLFAKLGCQVSGSDRDSNKSENQTIIAPLKRQGIKIFPQDGSFSKEQEVDCLIYSTAVEKDNPDFLAGAQLPKLHRAEALRQVLDLFSDKKSVAVVGSCGKTTVTAWLSQALENVAAMPSCLVGGVVNCFKSESSVGNYKFGCGGYFVFEADESDKSLLQYSSDYCLMLNIGTDHYEREVLIEMFAAFANKVKRTVVMHCDVYELIKARLKPELKVVTFSLDSPAADFALTKSSIDSSWQYIDLLDKTVKLPLCGKHNCENALGIFAMLVSLGFDEELALEAIAKFDGVWRRFENCGKMACGARVFDDYAHNPEKITAMIKAVQAMTNGKVLAVFQPHGFAPLGFMRDELFKQLEENLRSQDEFIFLPPFYAGGTSSFSPTSQEVAKEFRGKGSKNYVFASERDKLAAYLHEKATQDDIVIILGARDNSLSDFAYSLT